MTACVRLVLILVISGGGWCRAFALDRAEQPAQSEQPSYHAFLARFHFSGQHRMVYRYSNPPDLGVPTEPGTKHRRESLALLRNLIGVELSLLPSLRTFVQLGGYYALGIEGKPQPPDADVADVAQLYVAWQRSAASELRPSLTLKLGRQEMPLGSTRWFSTRDGANVRQSLDILRMTVAAPRWTIELFVGLLPKLRRDAFDDKPDWRNQIWGTYDTVSLLPNKLLSVDLFALTRRREGVRYQDHAGRETRHTVGLRLFGETSFGTEFIEHALLQWGTLEDAHILAWGVSSALWQRLPAFLSDVRVGVRADALSGDARASDKRVGTFHPLFPNQTFFSPHPAVYPANVYALHPLIKVGVEEISLEAGCVFLWRQSAHDAVYGPAGEPALTVAQSARSYTGAQLSVQLLYQIDEHFDAEVAYAMIFAGDAIKQAGGRDVQFFGTTWSLRY